MHYYTPKRLQPLREGRRYCHRCQDTHGKGKWCPLLKRSNEIPNQQTIQAIRETEEYINSSEFKNRTFTNEEAFAQLDATIASLKEATVLSP